MSFSGEDFVPALPLIKIEDGGAWLAGSHCSKCGVTVNGPRTACPSCGSRDTLSAVKLGTKGKLYNANSTDYVPIPVTRARWVRDLGNGTAEIELL